MPLVFVYGTLKQGLPLHGHLARNGAKPKFLRARTRDLFLLDTSPSRPFPYLYAVPEAWDDAWGRPQQIWGEVYKCNSTLMNILDRVEGCPHHYDRYVIHVLPDPDSDRNPLQVHTYLAEHLPRPNSTFSDRFQPQTDMEDYAFNL